MDTNIPSTLTVLEGWGGICENDNYIIRLTNFKNITILPK